MQKIAYFIICRLLGWEITGKIPDSVKKAVIIVAPHTSLWDFVYGRLAFWVLDIDVRFMINEKYFFRPLGWLLKALGGQPVKQTRPTRLLREVFDHFKNSGSYFLVITPEGTRQRDRNRIRVLRPRGRAEGRGRGWRGHLRHGADAPHHPCAGDGRALLAGQPRRLPRRGRR